MSFAISLYTVYTPLLVYLLCYAINFFYDSIFGEGLEDTKKADQLITRYSHAYTCIVLVSNRSSLEAAMFVIVHMNTILPACCLLPKMLSAIAIAITFISDSNANVEFMNTVDFKRICLHYIILYIGWLHTLIMKIVRQWVRLDVCLR